MKNHSTLNRALFVLGVLILSSCSSGSGDSGSSNNDQNTPAVNYSVGGSIDNLLGSGLTLQNNGGDDLLITDSGSVDFSFSTQLADGDNYDVSVLVQPANPNQACIVANRSGVIAGANINDITINCVTETYSVGGAISGLAGSGLVLQNSNGDQLSVSGTGSVGFTMDTALEDGSAYQISIVSQPSSPSQICSVVNGAGVLNGANIENISIDCQTIAPDSYSVSGTVTNLNGAGLVLQNNGGDNISIIGTGTIGFTFNTPLMNGSDYDVSVITHPSSPNQECFVTNAAGTISGANVNNVAVNCVTRTYSIGGTVSGLAGSGLVLQNGAVSIPVDANGTFAQTVDDGSTYNITVASQPTNLSQTCTISNGNGTVNGSDVNIDVQCITNSFTIGGQVTGLSGGGLVLQNNGSDDLTINGSGTVNFSFNSAILDGGNYSVTVLANPTGPNQICTVINGSNLVNGSDVNNVTINCVTETFSIGGTVAGLSGSGLVLQNNSTDSLVINGTGTVNFTFPTNIEDASNYNVTVATQPGNPNQICSVVNGTGVLAGSAVTSIEINCAMQTYTIGGTITGLTGTGLVLQNNAGDNLAITGTGSVNFTFSTAIEDSASYNVTILSQPDTPPQTCTVSGGSGSVAGGNVTGISVACSDIPTYSISGVVIGLTGSGMVLQNGGGDDLVINGTGTVNFTFQNTLLDGGAYDVSIASDPNSPHESCTVTNGSGVITGSDITDVLIHCPVDLTWVAPLPQGNRILSIQWINNRYMAVGESGTVASSTDGANWVIKNIGDVSLSDITWTGTQYIIVGANGIAYTSSDGDSWTLQSTGTTSGLNSVTWTGSRIFAVGQGGTIISSADGVSWTTNTSNTTSPLHEVFWNPALNQTIAVGFSVVLNNGSATATSWSPVLFGSGWSASGVTWTGSQYVVVGSICSGNLCVWPMQGFVVRSTNGVTWTSSQTLSISGLYKVTWTGNLLVAVGPQDQIATSSNGIDWTQRHWKNAFTSLFSVASNGNNIVAMGDIGRTFTSTDGASWTQGFSVTDHNIFGISTNGSQYVAVGGGFIPGTSNTESLVATSADGISGWAVQNTGTSNILNDVVWTGSLWVAVGNNGTIVTSEDAVSWATRTSGTTNRLNKVYWDGTLIFALGNAGTALTSPDGITWIAQNTGVTSHLFGMAHSDSFHVITGTGALLTSSNAGQDWSAAQSVSPFTSLNDIVWTGDLFIAGTSGSSTQTIYASPDGVTWEVQNLGSNVGILDVEWNGNIIALLGRDILYFSKDGLSWSSQFIGGNSSYNNLLWGNDRYYLAGNAGKILYSE